MPALKDPVQGRNHEQGQQAGHPQAGHDGTGDRSPDQGLPAETDGQGEQAGNGRGGGHEDGHDAPPRRVDRGVQRPHASLDAGVGGIDEHDGAVHGNARKRNDAVERVQAQGIAGQDIASVLTGLTGIEGSAAIGLLVALLVAVPLLIWVLRSADFRSNVELLAAGLIIGLLIVAGWYITAGPGGTELLDELEFMDERPFFTGAQSFTFIGPSGHILQYVKEGFSAVFLTFGIATVFGIVVGSLLYTVFFRKVRIEWFVSWDDFARHVAGGILMGIGGVLAMGCTIGQGVTGLSTLALGSFLTLVSIIAGSAATMKYQYYLMMRE